MNWKHYKALPPDKKQNEAYYIIGLDIGNESSGIAFYNLYENTPEPIDLSGGYGKPSIPTVIQYIPETKEWVFGEYAVLNQGAGTEITLKSLVRRLGNFDYIEIDGKNLSIASILGLFIKELLGSVKNINPKAEIVGIIAAIPDRLTPDAQDELKRAFRLAGYEKELVALLPSREILLSYYYGSRSPKNEKIMVLDYGSREVRGGVYEVGDIVTAMSSLFNEKIGTGAILADVYNLFEAYISTPGYEEQLTAFTYQHKDILFQKNIRIKPAKIYYNFVYPPFQQTITHADVDALVAPYRQSFNRFISDTLEKNIAGKGISPREISSVLCVGGGFEMLWAREAVSEIFAHAQINMYKNSKMIVAEGAAEVAAVLLGVIPGNTFNIVDEHQLSGDIGIKSGDVFLPLVMLGAFWWQNHQPQLVLVNSQVDGEIPLSIARRSSKGDEQILASHILKGLPPRPKGTTRLSFGVDFSSNTRMTLKVADMGFGELHPKTDYSQTISVKIRF
ncbi:MAG: DUF5716 family protein [Defluviitaleaceae bacterium]|nr:DUF5716 family protein [Defluviitaleaceae bacterium]